MAGDERRSLERRLGYRPLPSQRKFHRLDTRFKGFSGPVGTGKSAALCFEAVKLSYQNPGRTGLIGAPTYNMLRDATMDAFLDLLAEHSLPYELNRSSFTLRMKDSRSRILFRSLDDFEKLRGSNLAWFGVDELTYTSEGAWTRLEARLRDPKAKKLCGFGVWTPKGFDWVYRRFRSELVEGYGLVEAKPFENRYLLKQTPDFYDRLKASYDEAFFKQEVLGSYLNLQAGQVYYAFERSENVGDFELDPDEALLWSWDFNVNPMSSVIAQRRGDEIYVLDEICLSSSATTEACDEFERRYGKHRGGVRVVGDASGRQRHTTSSYSDYQLIREFFARRGELRGKVTEPRSNPPVRDRLNLTNAWLCSANEMRRLFVDRRCKELIKDLEQVSYKPDSGVIDKEKDSSRTHLSDALGYLLWQEVGSSLRAGEQSRRLI